MKILDSLEPQIFPEIVSDLMLLAREFKYNNVIGSLGPQQAVLSRQENIPDLLQELDREIRNSTFEADLRSIRESLSAIQGAISVIREVSDGKLEMILSELEKMAEKVKKPSK
jgi:hypothetical protein